MQKSLAGPIDINVKIGEEQIKIPKGTTLLELSRKYHDTDGNPCLVAKVNNELHDLIRAVTDDCTIEFLDITTPNGFRVYQRSVSFLMICAVKEIISKKTRVVIEHSINKNYYCEILDESVEITKELLKQIEVRMHEIAEKDITIEKHSISKEEAVLIAKKFGLDDKIKTLKFRRTANVNFYKLDWFYDYYYGQMVPNTGLLKEFALTKQGKGFVLQFASPANPSELLEVKALKKLTEVFHESNKWARILSVDTVGALSERICAGERGNVIRVNEALHEKRISSFADAIFQKNKKVVLIAGPSSSGKTTFAQRLSIQLRVNGLKPHIISLDNYYVDREQTPLDEYGEYDFEALEAIDFEKFNEDLLELLKGKTVHMPTFNFMSGKREYKGDFLTVGEEDVLVIEGIHGLNEKLSHGIPKENKFKIFISALTQLNLDDHNRIPTTDTRLIRRMVRDSQFRGFGAIQTIGMWPSVMRGEQKNIFPFQEEADVIFNSALIYELCVLKQYAEPLLFGIDKSRPEYTEARRLVKFLDCFISIPSEEVPNNSIIREFIGGSCFRT